LNVSVKVIFESIQIGKLIIHQA